MAETTSAKFIRANRAMEGLQHARWLLANGGSDDDRKLAAEHAIRAIEAAETEFQMIMSAMAGKW